MFCCMYSSTACVNDISIPVEELLEALLVDGALHSWVPLAGTR